MKKRDFIIIAVVLCVALLGMAAVRFWPASGSRPSPSHSRHTATTASTQEPGQEETAAPISTPEPEGGAAVVRIYVGRSGDLYDELPLDEDRELEIDQGGGKVNHVEVKDGMVRMQDSTCPDKLCVGQGDMSEDNVDRRVMSNMIVCLPNQVLLELVTVQEAAS